LQRLYQDQVVDDIRAVRWDVDPVILALRAKFDEMEKTENPKPNSSAKIAERIRKWNDRGCKV